MGIRGSRVSSSERDAIRRHYDEHGSVKRTAKEFERSRNTIRRVLRKITA